MSGQIFQINMSDGGVPKSPHRVAEVTPTGLIGDRQRDTVHHGGPERAVSLFSLERILALQIEGHPIYPGATGENVTVAGLDWAGVVPGARLKLGPEVELLITSFAVPCSNIRHSFRDERIKRLSQKNNPGWSRVYARVVSPGAIRLGDPVQLKMPG